MFNVQILNDAVAKLSPEGKEQLQLMINKFDEYKLEVEKLRDIADESQKLANKLQIDNENLQATVDSQAEKITELLNEKAN
jgi:predicted DNA-binding protein (UPF0251 family)